MLLPVFLVVLSAVLEFGWYYFVRSGAAWALRSGCRAGTFVATDADPGPSERTEAVTEELLASAGIGCGLRNHCTVETTVQESDDGASQECVLTLVAPPLLGLVPVPSEIALTTNYLREL